MPRVHVVEFPRFRIVLRVKESCVSIGSGGFVNKCIDMAHQARKIVAGMKCLTAQACLQTGHHQRRPDPLSRHIADRDAEFSAGQFKKIVIVAANTQRWATGTEIVQSLDAGKLLREQPFLHLAGDVQLGVEAFLLCGFPCDSFSQA